MIEVITFNLKDEKATGLPFGETGYSRLRWHACGKCSVGKKCKFLTQE